MAEDWGVGGHVGGGFSSGVKNRFWTCWAAQLVRALSRCTEVVGSIPRQGADKQQLKSVSVSGTTNQGFSLPLPLQNFLKWKDSEIRFCTDGFKYHYYDMVIALPT